MTKPAHVPLIVSFPAAARFDSEPRNGPRIEAATSQQNASASNNLLLFSLKFREMAPIIPFNASEITEKARRDLLLLLEGVR
jgi:hypothetical protein